MYHRTLPQKFLDAAPVALPVFQPIHGVTGCIGQHLNHIHVCKVCIYVCIYRYVCVCMYIDMYTKIERGDIYMQIGLWITSLYVHTDTDTDA